MIFTLLLYYAINELHAKQTSQCQDKSINNMVLTFPARTAFDLCRITALYIFTHKACTIQHVLNNEQKGKKKTKKTTQKQHR